MKMDKMLEEKALYIRTQIIEMVEKCGAGHLGGSLSAADIVISLYYKHMEGDRLSREDDQFILSKGHAAILLYCILKDKNIISDKEMLKFGYPGAILQTHPSISTPSVLIPSGSLGQGLSGAIGIAIAKKMKSNSSFTYVLIGDGEMNEGQIWEALMAAAHYRLNNLILFVDVNGYQLDGATEKVMRLPNLQETFRAFNWNVIEIDGHDFCEIEEAINFAKKSIEKPTVVLCKTTKGKGISFMENNNDYHSGFTKQGIEEYEASLKELRDFGGIR